MTTSGSVPERSMPLALPKVCGAAAGNFAVGMEDFFTEGFEQHDELPYGRSAQLVEGRECVVSVSHNKFTSPANAQTIIAISQYNADRSGQPDYKTTERAQFMVDARTAQVPCWVQARVARRNTLSHHTAARGRKWNGTGGSSLWLWP